MIASRQPGYQRMWTRGAVFLAVASLLSAAGWWIALRQAELNTARVSLETLVVPGDEARRERLTTAEQDYLSARSIAAISRTNSQAAWDQMLSLAQQAATAAVSERALNSSPVVDLSIVESQELRQAKQHLEELQSRRVRLLDHFTPLHPDVRELTFDIDHLAAVVASLSKPQSVFVPAPHDPHANSRAKISQQLEVLRALALNSQAEADRLTAGENEAYTRLLAARDAAWEPETSLSVGPSLTGDTNYAAIAMIAALAVIAGILAQRMVPRGPAVFHNAAHVERSLNMPVLGVVHGKLVI